MTTTAFARTAAGADSHLHVCEDATALGQHLLQCRRRAGLRHTTALWLDSAHQVVGPRFMTTVAGATLALAAITWWV